MKYMVSSMVSTPTKIFLPPLPPPSPPFKGPLLDKKHHVPPLLLQFS